MAKKVRLTCDVTKDVMELVITCGRMIQFMRGAKTKAVRVLMHVAFDTPTGDIHYFEGKEKHTISVEVLNEDVATLEAYMSIHSDLNERRKGFKSALLRGCGIFMHAPDKQALVDSYKERLGFVSRDDDED